MSELEKFVTHIREQENEPKATVETIKKEIEHFVFRDTDYDDDILKICYRVVDEFSKHFNVNLVGNERDIMASTVLFNMSKEYLDSMGYEIHKY